MSRHDDRKVLLLADLDQIWADLRKYRDDVAVIAELGLPPADDAETADYQENLIRMMACVVVLELDQRRLEESQEH
jgi:hypothetical protein